MTSDYRLKVDDYTVHDLVKRIRKKPETWTGPPSEALYTHPLYDFENNAVITKDVMIAPANIKLVKEILSNATDCGATTVMHCNWDENKNLKSGPLKTPNVGRIEMSMTDTSVSITNGGNPIPIGPCSDSTKDLLIVPPFKVFGTTYSGTNDDKDRLGLGSGRNGIGAKATNILSTNFIVEVGNNIDGQEFICHWSNNMLKVEQNTCTPGFAWNDKEGKWITKATSKNRYKGENYVRVTYVPDFEYYEWSTYDYDRVCLFAQLANSAAFSSRIPIDFSFQLEGMSECMSKTFSYKKTSDYLKLYHIKSDHSKEMMFWTESANYGQVRSQKRSITELSLDEQKKIAYNPMCMEDFPLAEVYMYDTPHDGKIISFVNGNETPSGGIHVNAIINPIIALMKNNVDKLKAKTVDAALLAKHVTIVCLYRLNQPTYGDQAKSKLDNFMEPKYKAGKVVINRKGEPDMTKRVTVTLKNYDVVWFKKWGAFTTIKSMCDAIPVGPKKLTSGKRHVIVPKLNDANLAGSFRGHLCTLFVPEGDSAKDYPSAMINRLPGKMDLCGILPLRGKLVNVSKIAHNKGKKTSKKGVKPTPKGGKKTPKATDGKIVDEEPRMSVVESIVTAVGLQQGADYSTDAGIASLRYGYICCMKDADTDGDHINCLLINLLYEKYPSFIAAGRYLYFETPIIRILRTISVPAVGDPEVEIINRFYNETSYDEWKAGGNDKRGYKTKYLKGLGSSNSNDRKDDALHGRMVVVLPSCQAEEDETGVSTRDTMYTAFGKKMTNERKKWINHYRFQYKCEAVVEEFATDDLGRYVPNVNRKLKKKNGANKKHTDAIKIPDSVPHTHYRKIPNIINSDLVMYSLASFERGIPSIRDGMKKSWRQAMWVIENEFDYGKSPKDTMKISRLSAKITEQTNYRHGDVSMHMVIIKQCQCFTGGNNIPIYRQDGLFGTRRYGGTDVGPSKARYAYTKAEKWHHLIMDKHMTANVPQRMEEGDLVEPYFIPMLIPLVLINGTKGLSTGYCTIIPAHNIFDIITWYKLRCDNKFGQMPLPWYKGFIGKNIVQDANLRIVENFNVASILDSASAEVDDEDEYASDEDDDEAFDEFINECEEGDQLLDDMLNRQVGQKMLSFGIFEEMHNKDGSLDVHITELPIGVCHDMYRGFMLEWIKEKAIEDFRDGGDFQERADDALKFVMPTNVGQGRGKGKGKGKSKGKGKDKDPNDGTDAFNDEDDGSIVNIIMYNVNTELLPIDEVSLKLKTSVNMSNMNLINKSNYPMHFNNIGEIMNFHFFIMVQEFEKLRQSNIAHMIKKVDTLTYKILLIQLIDEGKVGTKVNGEGWKREMAKVGIPKSAFAELLLIPVKVLIKEDTDKLYTMIEDLKADIEIEKVKLPADMYLEKLIKLEEAFDGSYPRNTNPATIANVAKINGEMMK